MIADRKVSKVRVWAMITLLLSLVFQQDLLASELDGDSNLYVSQNNALPYSGNVAENSTTANDKDEKIRRLSSRIEYLEGKVEELQGLVIVMNKQLGLNRTMGNLVKESRSLASDAWDLAVEARTIATRAEQKADQALRDKK